MVTVNLFQSGGINAYILLPESWQELDTAELIEFARLQLQYANQQHAAKAALLLFIIKYRAKQQKVKLPKFWQLGIHRENFVIDGIPLLNFLYNDIEMETNPLPVITINKIFKTKLYGPESNFTNITCGEFEDAEQQYFSFAEKPNQEALAQLTAILWRPKNMPYHGYDKLTYLKAIRRLKPEILFTVYLFYTASRNRLPTLFPTIYEGDGSKADAPDMMAFTKCIHAAAGPKNGTRENIRKMLLLELMYDMELEAINAKKLQQEYEQHQRSIVH